MNYLINQNFAHIKIIYFKKSLKNIVVIGKYVGYKW